MELGVFGFFMRYILATTVHRAVAHDIVLVK